MQTDHHMARMSQTEQPEHLTDKDWEALAAASWLGGVQAWRVEIERILTERVADRLAAVEALADKWAADIDGLPRADVCARQLRAALHPSQGDDLVQEPPC